MLKVDAPLHVSMAFSPNKTISAGRLAFDRNAGVFEYDPDFIASNLTLNPFFAEPSRAMIRAKEPRLFAGLHGVFADSLPEAYGELLLRRRARANAMNYSSLSSLQKLSLIGRRGPGALVYEPAEETDGDSVIDLDLLSNEASKLLEGHESSALPTLERLGGSSGGARPKILIAMNDKGSIISGIDHIPPGFTAWIIKFRSNMDFFDIGPLEAAYSDMARASGIAVPTTRLISTDKGPGYFATQRFDRGPDGIRLHMLSVAGMLELDWQGATIDYDTLLKVTRRVTRNEEEVTMMFRRMVFNVLAHNRDDHTKQHAFLMDQAGTWRLAPAYDLTFSNGPAGEHYLPIAGAAFDVRKQHILRVAHNQGINAILAERIIVQIAKVINNFSTFAQKCGVSNSTAREVSSTLKQTVSFALS